tara:strand:- start:562 stop:666 length:105 start_codon:yes stop_codon:yes gene_type:complete
MIDDNKVLDTDGGNGTPIAEYIFGKMRRTNESDK